MTKEQQKLVDFHRKFGLTVNYKPTVPSLDEALLRAKLIFEEYEEFEEAQYHSKHPGREELLVEVADALGDLLYVVYGAAVTYGIDLEPVFNEIHRSNMSKLWTHEEADHYCSHGILDKEVLTFSEVGDKLIAQRSDHKIIKSPSYSPVNLKPILFP